MSDVSGGPGWWIASDGKWYRPEQHPSVRPSLSSPASSPVSAPAPTTDVWITAPPSQPPQTTEDPATFVTPQRPPTQERAGPAADLSTRPTAITPSRTVQNRWWMWAIAGIVLIAIIGGIANATKKKPSPARSTPAPVVLLRMSGSGTGHSTQFTVPRNVSWDEAWTYDCSAAGGSTGNFMTHVYTAGGSLVAVGTNELGNGGSGSYHYVNTGTFAIEVDSDCSWSIKVVTVP